MNEKEKKMNDETKKQISLMLMILKEILIDNGVSIGLDLDNKAILFFSTDVYCDTCKISGINVKIEDLVK